MSERVSKGLIWKCKNGWWFGAEFSPIVRRKDGARYMDRYILHLGPINLRLHKIYRGDDDRAVHCHPWSFITFPFHSYVETVWNEGEARPHWHIVQRFRFHYRPAGYRHYILQPYPGSREKPKPFWTFVVATTYQRAWGFWPTPDTFIPHREWKD